LAIRSVVDTRFPLAKHCLVGLFIVLDFALVFQLGEFGGSLFVHLLLEVGALDAVLLVHLLENVHLVVLPVGSLLRLSGLELSVLLSDGCGEHLAFLLLDPLDLLGFGLLVEDVLLTGVVHTLEQIDSSLVLSDPLSLSHFVLSLGLLLHEFLDFFLPETFVSLELLVVSLKLDDFPSALLALLLFDISKGLFLGESGFQ